MTPSFTVVVGVDKAHLPHFECVIKTWQRFKPSLFEHPWVIFYDDSMTAEEILDITDEAGVEQLVLYRWPDDDRVQYPPGDGTKWTDRQRYKMLAGFVHVPARIVSTLYWLKLDLDVVAAGHDDWIDPSWFNDRPVIIAHKWSYTKPANQILMLDEWASTINANQFYPYLSKPPLKLAPSSPDSNIVGHKRIISWCGFFDTAFTQICSIIASRSCGSCKLPVPSQDGYLFYMAKRAGLPVVRTNMKARGWKHCPHLAKTRRVAEEVMNGA